MADNLERILEPHEIETARLSGGDLLRIIGAFETDGDPEDRTPAYLTKPSAALGRHESVRPRHRTKSNMNASRHFRKYQRYMEAERGALPVYPIRGGTRNIIDIQTRRPEDRHHNHSVDEALVDPREEIPNPNRVGAGSYLREGLGLTAWKVEEFYAAWGAEVVKPAARIAYDHGLGRKYYGDVTTFFRLVQMMGPEATRDAVIGGRLDPIYLAENFTANGRVLLPTSAEITQTLILGNNDPKSNQGGHGLRTHDLSPIYSGVHVTVFDSKPKLH